MLINLIGERREEVVSINEKRSKILLTNLTTNKSKTFEENHYSFSLSKTVSRKMILIMKHLYLNTYAHKP